MLKKKRLRIWKEGKRAKRYQVASQDIEQGERVQFSTHMNLVPFDRERDPYYLGVAGEDLPAHSVVFKNSYKKSLIWTVRTKPIKPRRKRKS